MSLLLLRETIRALIIEAAFKPEAAASQGLALYIVDAGATQRFVLYNPKYYTEKLAEDDVALVTDDSGGIVAYFQLIGGPADSCAGAAEVAVSSAQKGYGPMMYDICMVYSKVPIMPDRSSVSASAANVWKYYETRQDVEKIQLSDDDCKTSDNSSLNFAYRPKFQVNYSQLQNNHSAFIKGLDPATAKYFQEHLVSMGIQFFDRMMY